MKKIFKNSLLISFALLLSFSCQKDLDDEIPSVASNLEVRNFIWSGLNLFYLWQADVPDLADNRFASQKELDAFLMKYDDPQVLFDALRVSPNIDRFSWMVDDYQVLEQQLQGTTKNTGVEFGLYLKPNSQTEIFGFVRYIIPNSDAATKDIKRGELFTAVNGTTLTVSNYQSLLFGTNETFTLNMAQYDGKNINPNGKSVSLTKTILTENPILINKVIPASNKKIGYLMYNGFYSDFDNQLNTVFGDFKSQGVTDLVLDLRYNGGGSVRTATYLASMITGQFKDKVFAKQQWNSKLNDYFQKNDPEGLINLFPDKIGTTPINSLNLTKVYILTTQSTASASELIINGLKPYINVVQIGSTTIGKNVGSITLYDSPDFSATNRNPNHKYAMQPIVFKIVNASNFGDYFNGIEPTIANPEYLDQIGTLGDANESLLKAAIANITGSGKYSQTKGKEFDYFQDSKVTTLNNQMYLNQVPKGLIEALKH